MGRANEVRRTRVTGKTCLSFHSWTIDTGPLVESNQEIWQEIAAALSKGKVVAAAHALWHHLEYVSATWPISSGRRRRGKLRSRGTAAKRSETHERLYGKAAVAAQSWGNTAANETAVKRKTALSKSNAEKDAEQGR